MPLAMCWRILRPCEPGLSRSQITSLYSSRYVALTTNETPGGACSIRSKSSTDSRGMMPRSSAEPITECDLPEPVCPYARIVPL